MMAIRLLTFNTLFFGQVRARLRALGNFIERSDLHVVCLQEVVWRRDLALLREITRSLPHAAYARHGPAVKGGLVILSRWPIEEQRYVVFRARSAKGWPNLDRLLSKGLLVTRIRVRDAPLVLVNTHLLANTDGDWAPTNAYARGEHAELKQLTAVLLELGAEMPVVVAGDFNVPRGTWLFDEFLAQAGLRDVLADEPGPTYRPTPEIPEPRAIDHVLVRASPHVELVTDAKIVLQDRVRLPGGQLAHLSDHYGIEASLQLRTGG
jgi:endonuclease/exonuclease/phosphatase family metal-dependent hydrolase